MNVLVWDADCVDDNGGIPEPGDEIEYGGDDFLVVKVAIINQCKVEIQISTFYIDEYEDELDPSSGWKNIDEKYLPKKDTNFLDNGLSLK